MKASRYSIVRVKGESLKGTPLAEKIIALDRRNMEATLRAVGREFPEERRKGTLFAPSNRMIVAMKGEEVVGYVDYCDDPNDPRDLYLSSIQVEAPHRGGMVFKLLLSELVSELKTREFNAINTHIQLSNPRMLAIAKKVGFTFEENSEKPGTLNVFATREILNSPTLKRLTSHPSHPTAKS